MQWNKRTSLAFILGLTLILGACNANSETETTTEGNTDSENTETKVFELNGSEVDIPTNPERIVTDIYAGEFFSVGANVVGAGSWSFGNPLLEEQLADVTDIGDPVNLETVLAAEPDLIVVMSDENLDELEAIAPTVVIPYNTTTTTQDTVALFGEIAGREQEAEQFISDFEEKAAQGRQELEGVIEDGATVGLYEMTDKGAFWVFGDAGGRGGQALYNALGLEAPETIQSDIIETGEVKELSMEVVPDYAADYIFITDYNPEGTSNSLDQFTESAIWNDLDAVKNNRVFVNDFDTFYPYNPISVSHQIDLFVEMIKERATENGE
ncbi:iron-hydroxamate ABC transporter substrate-binding protein [Alkalihalobacillus sp. FSL W8-0930]